MGRTYQEKLDLIQEKRITALVVSKVDTEVALYSDEWDINNEPETQDEDYLKKNINRNQAALLFIDSEIQRVLDTP